MVRTLLYLFGGVLLGAAIHLVVILTLPGLASNNVSAKLADSGPDQQDNLARPPSRPVPLTHCGSTRNSPMRCAGSICAAVRANSVARSR